MKSYLLDTNIILRFLRRDDDVQSPKAKALIDQAAVGQCRLRIGWHVIAETVWALRHHYQAPREDIADSLVKLLQPAAIECDRKPVALDGLTRYGASKLDIVDCLLAAESAASGEDLATFDRGIGKAFGDMKVWDPAGSA